MAGELPETEEDKPQKPADPRRAPDVLFALELAGKRDPHPDPIKPIGRVSFLIWVAILATFYFAAAPAGKFIDLPQLQQESMSLAHGLTGSDHQRERTIRKIERGDHSMEIAAVAGFAGGTLLFASYYFLIYLVGMNIRRLGADAGHSIMSGARSVRAWYERRKARVPAVKADTDVRQTRAGPEPQIH